MKRIAIIALHVLVLMSAASLNAQQINPSVPPPPPPPEPAPESAPPPEPVFDPLHAERSIEIGAFYLKNGHIDAAIDRFEEAAKYEPTLAKPWRLLGEAYEKKHDYRRAVDSYQKYLGVFPGAPDAADVKKRVAALEPKIHQEAGKRTAH